MCVKMIFLGPLGTLGPILTLIIGNFFQLEGRKRFRRWISKRKRFPSKSDLISSKRFGIIKML